MKSVKVIVIVIAVLLVIFGTIACSAVPKELALKGENVNVTFKGKSESLGELREVTVIRPGISFAPEKIYPISRKQASWGTPEDAMRSVFSANKADDPNWIIENFAPNEQNTTKILLEDKDARNANKKFFDNGDYYSIKYDVQFWTSDYRILIIQFPSLENFSPFVFKQTSDGWKQTNDIQEYDTMKIIFQASISGQITEKVVS